MNNPFQFNRCKKHEKGARNMKGGGEIKQTKSKRITNHRAKALSLLFPLRAPAVLYE